MAARHAALADALVDPDFVERASAQLERNAKILDEMISLARDMDVEPQTANYDEVTKLTTLTAFNFARFSRAQLAAYCAMMTRRLATK